MKNFEQIEAWVWEQANKAARDAFDRLAADAHTALYVYHKPGAVVVATCCPEGFSLSTGERLPSHVSECELARRIKAAVWNNPCLPPELVETLKP